MGYKVHQQASLSPASADLVSLKELKVETSEVQHQVNSFLSAFQLLDDLWQAWIKTILQ
jgi:hypothetical protein